VQVSSRVWRHFDVWLLAAVAAVTIASVAMIQSAIAGNESLAEMVPRQMIYALIGLVIIVVTAAIDYRFWSAIARPIYVVVLLLLGLILASGFVGFGAARWFNVGIVLIQPSEISKVLMVIVVADYLARHQHEIGQFRIFIRSLVLTAVPAVLVFLQPDLSTAIVLGVIWVALVFASGAKLRYFLVLLAIAALVLVLLSPLLVNYFSTGYQAGEDFLFIQNYQMQRVVSFLLPDPEAHQGVSYNVNQALISIGSGGWSGQGYGHGTQTQLRFLKVRHTDFIFSALSEEFGFVGAVTLLAFLGFIILRCLRAARMARDQFGALICYGVAILLLFQSAINIGMNLALLPVSGLPLPFFSYGGSSLVASLLGIGMVESVILRHKRIEL
jgi:rod shape determining protein RodA